MTSESNLETASTTEGEGNTPPPAGGNDLQAIEQIRTILFGPQLRAMEDRFTRVEEMLLTHNSRLLNVLEKRIGVLEEQIETRAVALQTELEQYRETSGHAIAELDQQLRQQTQALRDEFETLSTEMSRQQQALRDALDEEAASLRQGAASHDRDLAALFQEMAAKLLQSVPE